MPTRDPVTIQNIPDAQHLPTFQNIPMYQNISESPRIQEIHLTDDLLQQGEQQDGYQDEQAQAQGYDEYYEDENFNLGFNPIHTGGGGPYGPPK